MPMWGELGLWEMSSVCEVALMMGCWTEAPPPPEYIPMEFISATPFMKAATMLSYREKSQGETHLKSELICFSLVFFFLILFSFLSMAHPFYYANPENKKTISTCLCSYIK